MANNVVDILKGVVGELKEVAKSETVIGEPVTVGDRTVLPVMKISFGFGAGGGQKEGDKDDQFGGGGGGGARIEPAAFIIMDEKGISLLPVAKGKWDTIIDAIPGIAGKLSKLKEKFKSDKSDKETTDKGDDTEDDRDTTAGSSESSGGNDE
ncbi:MAG: spore germination protein GerW family protein [candidate division Zixibacteria bacterium]|nr:spore germination protein GerW family protein [candidate division Zixibacteria bacterium]